MRLVGYRERNLDLQAAFRSAASANGGIVGGGYCIDDGETKAVAGLVVAPSRLQALEWPEKSF